MDKHILVEDGELGALVAVDDYELFDYVDDFLNERGLESAFTREELREGKRYYILQFDEDIVPAARIREVVAVIPSDEVSRIWEMNNSP